MKWIETSTNADSIDRKSWDCYADNGELIGYVDLLYTTLERDKYLGTFSMQDHPEQEELSEYYFEPEEARDFVESSYMAYRMIGTLDEPERD